VSKAVRVGAPRRLAGLYTQLVLKDVENLVASETFHRPLKRLVDALLMHRTISGAHAKRIVEHADEEILAELNELKGNDGTS
jgi:hypothetical protein